LKFVFSEEKGIIKWIVGNDDEFDLIGWEKVWMNRKNLWRVMNLCNLFDLFIFFRKIGYKIKLETNLRFLKDKGGGRLGFEW